MDQLKAYKKGFEYSYSLGAFPTYELIKSRPEKVIAVYTHSSYTDMESITKLCNENDIPMRRDDKLFHKISDKENCFVIGVFEKYESILAKDKSHIVLVNPSNMGNLGTIMRTALGLGIEDIALITPCADIYNPKTVRASMGALFKLRFHHFDNFSDYRHEYHKQDVFTFMLNGENTLEIQNCPKSELFSLVFGNEATGLDDSFLKEGTSICIPQSPEVDSLNITIAVGIGTFLFTHQK
ncbi:rRNA methyltransferase [Anaerocolumna cellulosilytica]|uniref:rRNA methyltransferase n=1 Tax=Anaerocolumna cellulosilytica TaxID=433286 RepID=A0A6S6R4U9_9FIRM|nr:TrmH family RNA methyltransferase [Anaerocolumna cellulosilytica]MBB5197572.1 TrmH family RNA methyltransferase [Anaerocolumna cellulosilytica]BCJ95097.1 rRNA methyltransferase [Anaerocolumna cellulosilytica]